MYHFDYVCKGAGAVFENYAGENMVTINGQKRFSFDDFINTFVLIENYKHPFTICTSAKRFKRIDKQLEKMGYMTIIIKQIDFDMKEENAFIYGAYHIGSTNPFKYLRKVNL